MAEREYSAEHMFESEVDWGLWEFLDALLIDRVSDKKNSYPYPYMLHVEDGKIEGDSIGDLMEQAKGETITHLDITRHRSDSGLWVGFEYFGGSTATVSARGPRQEEVLGFVEMVKLELEKREEQGTEATRPTIAAAAATHRKSDLWWKQGWFWGAVTAVIAVVAIIVTIVVA